MSVEDLKKEAMAENEKEEDASEVKIEMPETKGIDIHNRDPQGINGHIKVKFADIIAEPDPEVYSFDKVWELSFSTFTNTKIWCYRILSAIFALPCALCWGCYFACIAFCGVWCCMPCIKSEEIEIGCVRKIWVFFVDAIVAPCCVAFGKCLGGIRVHKTAD